MPRKPTPRTEAAEEVYKDLLERADKIVKTIVVNGKEFTTPVTVLPAFDPRLILAQSTASLHDVLNINPGKPGLRNKDK